MVANTRRKRRIIMESDEESEDELQVIEINSDEEQQNDDSIWDFQPLPKSATRYPKRKRKSRFPLLYTREESISGGAPLDPPNDEDYEEEEEEEEVDKEEKERKEKEKQLIDSIFQSDDLLIYPFSGKNAVSLQKRDLARLEEDELLNDALIDIYPKILQDEYPQTNIHTFSSLFYTRLTATKSKRRMSIDHSNVKRWTSNHDIFSKTCLIIPIEQRNHWYLVVVIHPALCIKALGDDDDDDDDDDDNNDDGNVNDIDVDIDIDNGDPMEDDNEEEGGGGGRGEREGKDHEKAMKKPYIAFLDPLGRRHPSTYRAVCQYLKEEAMDKLKVTEDRIVEPGLIRGDCPRQTNFSDCGIFCLHFIKQIYQNPEKIMEALVKRQVEAVTDEHWNKEDIPQLRRVLQSLLLNKFEEYELYTKEKMEK